MLKREQKLLTNNQIKKIELFEKFLKQNRAWSAYKRELEKKHFSFVSLGLYKPTNYIFSAFSWSKSEKGISFWAGLAVKWAMYYENNYREVGIV